MRWSTVVPRRVTASGSRASAPAATSRAAMSGARSAPLRNTTVVRGAASSAHARSVSLASTMRTWRTRPPVRPNPAYAGTPETSLTPGATSKSIRALRSAPASWSSEPSITGSPEISRTVVRPSRAASMTSALRPAWSSGMPLASTATTTSAAALAWARAMATASASTTISSAAAMRLAARSVSRSGSPGPAATSATEPCTGFLRALGASTTGLGTASTTGVAGGLGAAFFATGLGSALGAAFLATGLASTLAGAAFFATGLGSALAAQPSSRPAWPRPWPAQPSSLAPGPARGLAWPAACCWRLSLSCVDRLSQRICVK